MRTGSISATGIAVVRDGRGEEEADSGISAAVTFASAGKVGTARSVIPLCMESTPALTRLTRPSGDGPGTISGLAAFPTPSIAPGGRRTGRARLDEASAGEGEPTVITV